MVWTNVNKLIVDKGSSEKENHVHNVMVIENFSLLEAEYGWKIHDNDIFTPTTSGQLDNLFTWEDECSVC